MLQIWESDNRLFVDREPLVMAISFFFQFGAYQACACSEREFTLTDVFEAAAAMVQKVVSELNQLFFAI